MLRVITAESQRHPLGGGEGLPPWLARQKADCVCMQEIKAQRSDLPRAILMPGRLEGHFDFAHKKGYSGVGMYCGRAPDAVSTGFGSRRVRRRGPLPARRLRRSSRSISMYLPSGSSSRGTPAGEVPVPRARSCRCSSGSPRAAASSSSAATGTSRTARSTSGTGARTGRTRASCPRSAPGSPMCSTRRLGRRVPPPRPAPRAVHLVVEPRPGVGQERRAGASTTRSPRPASQRRRRRASIYKARRVLGPRAAHHRLRLGVLKAGGVPHGASSLSARAAQR